MDLDRVHYDQVVYFGTTGLNSDAAYQGTPPRAAFRPQNTLWVAGVGGVMGRMHLQRALENANPPCRVLATDVSVDRTRQVEAEFTGRAMQREVERLISNPTSDLQRYAAVMAEIDASGGVDDIGMLVSAPAPVVECRRHLAGGGIVNLFAGLKRGTLVSLDPRQIHGPRLARFIGHGGSASDDQVAMVHRALAGELVPKRSVVAVAGLRYLPDGLQAMEEATYPGKIVIFPQGADFPVTALHDLDDHLPEVFAKLGEGRFWTRAAEAAFLEALLP